ncbi:hypothetical protein OH76DRAFT_467084 [Lentinus brumalis]|uniref:PHD-type domain-containing protein n=1 Tax=Lentinus brumalis TaxID=2498619 RepID=A0A371DCK7_9APHY|nr:hypothetical protein OH76DRAFT_467084 [Polyporus brumalis]
MSAAAEVIPPPEVPCFRCKKSHDNPAAFLMACCRCERAWHHTCHIPPVTEDELMRRLKADNSGKRDVGLRAWQCRTCTKKRRLEAEPSSSIPPPAQRPCLARETTQPPSDKTSKPSLESTLIEDDEDAIMILDGPPLPAPAGQLDFDLPKRLPPPPVHESRKLDNASQSPPRKDTPGSKIVPPKHSAPAVVRHVLDCCVDVCPHPPLGYESSSAGSLRPTVGSTRPTRCYSPHQADKARTNYHAASLSTSAGCAESILDAHRAHAFFAISPAYTSDFSNCWSEHFPSSQSI